MGLFGLPGAAAASLFMGYLTSSGALGIAASCIWLVLLMLLRLLLLLLVSSALTPQFNTSAVFLVLPALKQVLSYADVDQCIQRSCWYAYHARYSACPLIRRDVKWKVLTFRTSKESSGGNRRKSSHHSCLWWHRL